MKTDIKIREEQIKEYRNNIPNKFKDAYRKTYDKAVARKSFMAAIKAKCLDCMCWEGKEVKGCTQYSCPLYAYKYM